MNIKFFAYLTLLLASIFVVFTFMFNIPLAYIPEQASVFEATAYYTVFFVIEAVTCSFLLLHMLKKTDIEQDICEMFNSK